MVINWNEQYGTHSAQIGIMRLEASYSKDGYTVHIVGDKVLNYKQTFTNSEDARAFLIKAALYQVDKMRTALTASTPTDAR